MVYLSIEAFLVEHKQVVMATVVEARGSTPRGAGTTALMAGGRLLAGTVGGGLAELTVLRESVVAEDTHGPRLVRVNLAGDIVSGEAICGGEMTVLIQPLTESNATPFREMAHSLAQREPGILVTLADWSVSGGKTIQRQWIPAGHVRLIREGGTFLAGTTTEYPAGLNYLSEGPGAHPGTLGVRALQEEASPQVGTSVPALSIFIRDEMIRMLEHPVRGEFRHFSPDPRGRSLVTLEMVLPSPAMFIAGAGHIGQALTPLAKMLGFEVTVWDDRPAIASIENLPHADHLLTGPAEEALAHWKPGRESWIVIVTHGHRNDGAVLKYCIHTEATYIGMIGSKAKVAQMRSHFLAQGWATPEEWNRIYTPIGLDIGAKTVEEIAVAIAAQIIQVRNQGYGQRI
jgi:xanthine dehydrogenase accessory factor